MVTGPDMPDDEMVLAYIRGDLDARQTERIARLSNERPDLAADIALIRGVRAADAADAEAHGAPGALGWARLAREIDADRSTGAGRPGHMRPMWQLAAAAICAVGLWQFAVVPFLSGRQEGQPGYAPVSEATVDGPQLRVAFAPDATEGDIRALLQAIGAEITAGPGALGLWTLAFTDQAARTAGLAELQSAELVESVQD
jgi:hypothetical protein